MIKAERRGRRKKMKCGEMRSRKQARRSGRHTTSPISMGLSFVAAAHAMSACDSLRGKRNEQFTSDELGCNKHGMMPFVV